MTRPQTAQSIPPPVPKALPAARSRWLVPSLLALLYVTQCAWFIRTQSLTYDEPVHIAEGLNAWRYGRFEQYNDHPPLARLWCTIPLIGSKWQVEIQQLPDSFRVTRIAPDPVSLAWRARAMNVLLGLALAAAGMVGRRPVVLPDSRKFRARPVCVLAFADRAFFDRGHRRCRYVVYFCHCMGPGALAARADLAKDIRARIVAGPDAAGKVFYGADVCAGPAVDASPGRRQSDLVAREVELGQDRGGAAARIRGGLGGILFSRGPSHRPGWHFDRHFSQLEPADRQTRAWEKLQCAGSGRRIRGRLPGTGPA